MEDFNKVISFVLGLIVVIVALVIIGRKYDLTKKLLPFSTTASVSVTPTPTGKVVSEVRVSSNQSSNQTRNYYQTQKPTSIPATGAPTFLLPLFGSSLLVGLKLRSKK